MVESVLVVGKVGIPPREEREGGGGGSLHDDVERVVWERGEESPLGTGTVWHPLLVQG